MPVILGIIPKMRIWKELCCVSLQIAIKFFERKTYFIQWIMYIKGEKQLKAALILENGKVFSGEAIGAGGTRVFELVFNTSMVGYQEVLTDPSYAGQGVVMTYPLIGNYGVNKEDNESVKAWPEAFIVRHLSRRGSNFRCEGTLEEFLIENDIVGIEGVDTRAITRILRDEGTMNAMIAPEGVKISEALEKIKAYKISDVVGRVTCKEPYKIEGNGCSVAMLDFGVKMNMIRSLTNRGCAVTVFPADTSAETILNGGFDGVMLSNGPGDPKDCTSIIEELKKLYNSDIPIFGVCLGHQLMALATGADTGKLKYGHRGGNHPVREISTGRVYITSQNHGYAVLADSVDPDIAVVSHVNANDGTVEGLDYKNGRVCTVQFHPEAAPGPKDTAFRFDKFIQLMQDRHSKGGSADA